MDFKIGDRVVVVEQPEDKTTNNIVGEIGTVMAVDKYVAVKFDNDIEGHNLNGRCEYGYGWNMEKTCIKKVEEEKMKEDEKMELITLKKTHMDYIEELYAKKKEELLDRFVDGNMAFSINDIIHGNKDAVVIKIGKGNKTYKAKAVDGDEFSLRRGLEVAMMKAVCDSVGVNYHKIIRYAEEMVTLLKEEESALEEAKAVEKRKKEKIAAKKAKRDARRREQRIEEQKEAILRAKKESGEY